MARSGSIWVGHSFDRENEARLRHLWQRLCAVDPLLLLLLLLHHFPLSYPHLLPSLWSWSWLWLPLSVCPRAHRHCHCRRKTSVGLATMVFSVAGHGLQSPDESVSPIGGGTSQRVHAHRLTFPVPQGCFSFLPPLPQVSCHTASSDLPTGQTRVNDAIWRLPPYVLEWCLLPGSLQILH